MRITAHGWEAELLPALGASFATLRHQGRDVLRAAPRGVADPFDAACFPLVPYANRIAQGRFTFAGQGYQLARNLGEHPHSLHGFGWQAAWTPVAQGLDSATLEHAHPGNDGWPWPYRAEQRVVLRPGVCEIVLSLANIGDLPMPGGLGLHPYFPCNAATRLTARAKRLWLIDEAMLPTVSVDPARLGDWAAGAPASGDTLIDNSYDGWDGVAEIRQAAETIALFATGARAFHLYRPPGKVFFCVEPVSHLPDAINRGGMDIVAPGAVLKLGMTIRV